MRSIFISYRREDAEGQAGRLFDDLTAQFGKDSVFMDVVDIEPGRDFRRVIDQHVASCGVLLAVIGKGWLDAKDQAGRRRLDNPNDFVRLETVSALKRDIPVIPVLVQGAAMPREEQLPVDLKEFAFRNAVELSHPRWDSDVQILLKALGGYVGAEASSQERAASTSGSDATPVYMEKESVRCTDDHLGADGIRITVVTPPTKTSWRGILITSVAAIAVSFGGFMAYDSIQKAAQEQQRAAEKGAQEQRAAAETAAADRAAAEKGAQEQQRAAEMAATDRAAAEKAAAAVPIPWVESSKTTHAGYIHKACMPFKDPDAEVSKGSISRIDVYHSGYVHGIRIWYGSGIGSLHGYTGKETTKTEWKVPEGERITRIEGEIAGWYLSQLKFFTNRGHESPLFGQLTGKRFEATGAAEGALMTISGWADLTQHKSESRHRAVCGMTFHFGGSKRPE